MGPRARIPLVLCVLLGSALGCCSNGVSKVVVVGPTEKDLSNPEVTISMKANDVVYWRSNDGRKLTVTFKRPFPPEAGDEPPFIGGTVGQNQEMTCKDGVCFSYSINPRLKRFFDEHPDRTLRYEYEQTLGERGADGGIIIKP